MFGTIRSQVTICYGMDSAPPLPPPPGGGPMVAAAAGAAGASGGGGGGGAAAEAVINANTYKAKLSAMPKQFESTSQQQFRHMQSWLSSDARNHTKEAVSDACLMQLRIKDGLELWYSNQGGLSDFTGGTQ